ncbi:MAG: glutamine--fructose-6-phosphate aminotransferase, partial [Propionibacterium sp.]|nr:glutamine--fructose-6-phosphate aminotransferase [Propionibacterium sp.]
MCGIVGYVGTEAAGHSALDVIMEGLRRLEYRGYDSAGVAVAADGTISHRKKAGKLANLADELDDDPLPASRIGIGHTRWATHGGPTDKNAHPHVVDDNALAVIHNGIIENFAELRAELAGRGHEFTSETDTEVAAVLLAETYNDNGDGDLTRAMQDTARRLEGAFTLLALHRDR